MSDAKAVSEVRVEVLGPLRVVVDGREVALGGPVPRALVARLLLARGAVVSDDELVDQLWEGAPPADAAGGLQTVVSRLRRVLEPTRGRGEAPRVLVRCGTGYALRLQVGAIDGDRFVDAVRAGAQLRAQGRAGAALEVLREALGWCRGTAYADVVDREFAVAEAARLEQLRTDAEEELLAVHVDLGDPTAVPALRARVRQHPLRERGWELLALGLYRQGRQGEALAALRELAAVLADELGADPGPSARALECRVLQHDPALLAPPARTASAAQSSPSAMGLRCTHVTTVRRRRPQRSAPCLRSRAMAVL